MLFLVTFQSCDNEVNSLEPLAIDSPSEQNLLESKHSSTFFSNAYTTELLSNFNANFQNHILGKEQPESQVYQSEILIKAQMMNLDTHFQNSYVSTIIPRGGYPLWEAGWMINIDEEASFYGVPILKEDSEEIEGLISLVRFNDENGKTLVKGYSLTYRSELNEADPVISNKDFYQLWFDFYDNSLFDNNSAIPRDGELGSAGLDYFYDEGDCVAGISTGSTSYEVCLCTENLTTSNGVGIWNPVVNTQLEEAWVNANCDYAHAIDVFLGNHYSYDAGQTFLDIGMANELGIGVFTSMVNAIDVYMDDPNSSVKADQLYNFFYERGIDASAIHVMGIVDASNNIPQPILICPPGLVPYFGPDYFTPTNADQMALKILYPGQNSQFTNFWPCRVLGYAHEDASLTSLGLPLNNQGPSNDPLFTKKPDGFSYNYTLDFNNTIGDLPTIVQQPILIECKGRFSSTNLNYTYASQKAQFTGYRDYLFRNATYKFTSILHGLLIITPAGITLDQVAIIDKCSSRNVPLYHSTTEHGGTPATQTDFAVTKPVLLNMSGLNYSKHSFSFLGDFFMKQIATAHFRDNFSYDQTEINFEPFIAPFIDAYLVGNAEECTDDQ